MLEKVIRYDRVEAIATKLNGEKVEVKELPVFLYTGRKLSQSALKKRISEFFELSNEYTVMIKSDEVVEKKYQFDIKDFLKIAKEL